MAINNNPTIKPRTITGIFTRYIAKTIPLAFDESMSYYECLCALLEYINTHIVTDINNVNDGLDELQTFYRELQTYVNEYFDNLDVQEEINNKLDEMVEDGTLSLILNGKIFTTELSLSEYITKEADKSEIYAGAEHIVLQGLCYINGNIVYALRNIRYNDDYVKLVEINTTTKEILRTKYLELAHANSLFYRNDNNTIYVAGCNKVNSSKTGVIDDNRIFVLNYDDLTITKTINVDNLPTNARIRSVSYENGFIYGADATKIYKIDETTQHIIQTINLDTNLLNLEIGNQTIKFHNSRFIGLFLTYMVIWDINGHIIKILNISQNPNLYHIGEVEDFTFDNSNNIIIGSNGKISTYRENYETRFFRSNLFSGNDNEIFGAGTYDTSNISIYVNNTATNIIENGTESLPFHDLQKALTLAKNSERGCDIHIKGNTYDYIYINNIKNLILIFESNVTINGMRINSGDIYAYQSNGKFTINELTIINSDVKMFMDENNLSVLNCVDNRSLDITNSNVNLSNITINNNNVNEGVRIRRQSNVSFANISFTNESTYAISVENTSTLKINDISWGTSASETNHHIRLSGASNVITENYNPKFTQYTIQGNSKLYPSLLNNDQPSSVYFGKVCDIPSNCNMMKLKVKVAGTNGVYSYFDIPITSDEVNAQTLLSTHWGNATPSTRTGLLEIDTRNSELKIIMNRNVYQTSNSMTVTDTEETPSTTQNFACIKNVWFYTV